MESRMWPCAPCGEVTEFAQPPCVDGHTDDGGECPEWACAECGAAVVMGKLSLVRDVLRTRIAA